MSAKYDISYPCGLPGGLENFSKTWCGEATVDRCTNLWTLYMSRNSVRGGWTLKSLVNAQEMAEFGEREGWDSHVCVPFLGTIVPPSLPPVSNYQLFDSRTSGGNNLCIIMHLWGERLMIIILERGVPNLVSAGISHDAVFPSWMVSGN